jgi:predicted transcriptional regulator of viral defense system
MEMRTDILDKMLEDGNGYLRADEVTARGISRTCLSEYVKKRNLERVARGVYYSDEAWPDALFLLSIKNKEMCFSHETALHIHGLMEREPAKVTVTIKTGYNATHLRDQGVRVYTVSKELFVLGITTAQTAYGNAVSVYDRERTICDIIKSKDKMDIQVFQTALKEYMSSLGKHLPNLMRYAAAMRIEEIVRRYMEVML